jgi:Glycosyl transferase family 2
MKHQMFVSLPSARGVHPMTVWNLMDMRTELEKQGHRLHGSSVYRMPLDLARNELATAYLSTPCDSNLLMDDDVQVDPPWLPKMLDALDAGCDIISVPCRMRSEGNLFNIIPLNTPVEMGGLRVVECAWTGLGAVLVKRHVLEKLHAAAVAFDTKIDALAAQGQTMLPEKQTYISTIMPERTSAAIFKSRIDPAKRFFLESPADKNVYSLDDKAFSLRAIEAGFKIHAAVDVPSCHDGMRGCFAEAAAALDRERAREASRKPVLVGADGKSLRSGR